ncbi:17501_t:CDS:2, partial [Acaulospora colombiana]
CLKPGGIVIWIEGDYDFYSGYPIVYKPFASEANPSGSYLQRMGYELRRAVTANGSALKEVEHLMDQGLWWQSDVIDPDTADWVYSESPALPTLQSINPPNKPSLFIYEVHNTIEEVQEKMALRNRGKDIPPPPLPEWQPLDPELSLFSTKTARTTFIHRDVSPPLQ